jgi:hypothetical protein
LQRAKEERNAKYITIESLRTLKKTNWLLWLATVYEQAESMSALEDTTSSGAAAANSN